jgi:hypothetical protein
MVFKYNISEEVTSYLKCCKGDSIDTWLSVYNRYVSHKYSGQETKVSESVRSKVNLYILHFIVPFYVGFVIFLSNFANLRYLSEQKPYTGLLACLVSISSTFSTCILRQYFGAKKLHSQT